MRKIPLSVKNRMPGSESFGKDQSIGLHAGEHAVTTAAALGAKTRTTAGFARLLVVLATTHLFFDAASLYQLTKTTNGFLDRLFFTQRQLNHKSTPFLLTKQ
jgi:hypothetical protein